MKINLTRKPQNKNCPYDIWSAIRNSELPEHLSIVRPPLVLIEIFAKHYLVGFLSTFLILFAALSEHKKINIYGG